MKFWQPSPADAEMRIRFIDLKDANFKYEPSVSRHYLNVIDKADDQLKVLSLPSSAMKNILEHYRLQMISDRRIMQQKADARRFRYSKMKYRAPYSGTKSSHF